MEDIENMRETWLAVLERENFRADGAATAQAAIDALELCTYHVALVDIMLAGKDDTSNRDGVKVLKHLRELREGSLALVLSGQKSDITLVRDLIKEYEALDYIAKWDVQEKGNAFLVQKIRDALEVSPLRRVLAWDELVKIVARGQSEHAFVAECLRVLRFSGGFENLSRSLIAACQNLMPLLVEVGTSCAIGHERVPEVLNGKYWSKGQGCAIELLIYGKNAPKDSLEREWGLGTREPLYSRTKGDLSLAVIERRDLSRGQFGPAV